MSRFFTRRRLLILLPVFAVAFLFWLSVIAGSNDDDTARSGAEAAGYFVGSMIAAPAVLALVTILPVVAVWWLIARRSR